MKDALKTSEIVCVFDQSIFAKAAEIKWKSPEKYKDCELVLDVFHMIMSFISILAKRFGDAVLRDTLVQAGVLADGSAEVISNKQYVDQVLADANIISQTSKLNAKIELLEKENMELRRIVINKEIIIQKLSANKNITKEIPKNEKTDCSTNKDEEYSFCEIVTECSNPPNEKIHHKNDSN